MKLIINEEELTNRIRQVKEGLYEGSIRLIVIKELERIKARATVLSEEDITHVIDVLENDCYEYPITKDKNKEIINKLKE